MWIFLGERTLMCNDVLERPVGIFSTVICPFQDNQEVDYR